MPKGSASPLERAEILFRKRGGMLRTSRALALGIHPRTLYALRDSGRLVEVARGLYRLAHAPTLSHPDLVRVATLIPEAVICLISALAFHEIGTLIPREVHIALPRTARRPRLPHPPMRVFRFSGPALTEGVEFHKVDGVEIRVYSVAKTVADCFKYRHKIGLDVALEALRDTWRRHRTTMDELWRYAATCRVENVIRPYLESLT
jgi:predicted transcriptional regulator of viral defense system